MTRLHTDPVEVRSEHDAPAQFLWRGRLYLVREVVARWTESGQWWRTPAVRSLTSGDSVPGTPEVARVPAGPARDWAQSASLAGRGAGVDDRADLSDGGGAVSGMQVGGVVGVDDGEREWWRVEAGSGRLAAFRDDETGDTTAGTGVYDLCYDAGRGSWSLARVLD